MAYVLLCGFPPFNAGSEGGTYDMVKEGIVRFPSPAWDKISKPATDFVKLLLDRDPNQRPSASQALEDPWIKHEKVNPFRRLWQGTFLHHKSHEARSIPRHMKLQHQPSGRQVAYEKDRQHAKKKKMTRRGDLKRFFGSGKGRGSVTKKSDGRDPGCGR